MFDLYIQAHAVDMERWAQKAALRRAVRELDLQDARKVRPDPALYGRIGWVAVYAPQR